MHQPCIPNTYNKLLQDFLRVLMCFLSHALYNVYKQKFQKIIKCTRKLKF